MQRRAQRYEIFLPTTWESQLVSRFPSDPIWATRWASFKRISLSLSASSASLRSVMSRKWPTSSGLSCIVRNEDRAKFHRKDGPALAYVFLFIDAVIAQAARLPRKLFLPQFVPLSRSEINVSQLKQFLSGVAQHFLVGFVEIGNSPRHVNLDESISHGLV